MDEACGMDRGKKKYIQVFAGEMCKEKEAGLDKRIRIKQIFKNWYGSASTGLIWLRYGEMRGLSWTRQ
jgi:hypothetical protein